MTRLVQACRAHWAIILPAIVSLYIFPYLPGLRSPNEICRTYQTRAVVDHHTLEINAVIQELGWIGDLSCVAIAHNADGTVERRACPSVAGQRRFQDMHYYPSKAPLISMLAVPVYALLKALHSPVPEVPLIFFGRLFCTILPTLILLIPMRRFLRAYVEARVADAVTATYALGTLAFSYSELFMSHQMTGVLLFACFFVLWRIGRGEWPTWSYAIAGLLAGLTVVAEYTGALGLIPLAAYGIATMPGGAKGKASATAIALVGVLPPAIALGWYHQIAYGSPFASGYKFLNDSAYQGWHVKGFLGIGLPDARALVLSFFSPLRGFFTLSPFMLLALPGLAPTFWRPGQRAELAVSLSTLLLYAYFTSSFSYESWGWTTGPRHLTSLVPFLLLPIALFVDSAVTSGSFMAGVAAGLAVVSIAVTSVMTLLNYIPDAMTNGLTELAVPLAISGYLPQTWLSLAGVPNPWAALPAIVGVAATGLVVGASLLPSIRRGNAVVAALSTVALIGGVLSIAAPRTARERSQSAQMINLLKREYVPRPGHASPPLW